MRRAIALLGVTAALIAASDGPASAAASQGITIAPVSTSNWPDRSYVLTLPSGTTLDPSAVHVSENGVPVDNVSVSGGNDASNKFGEILMIDATNTMKGAPIADAMKAARAFAAERAPNQPLAVLTFSRTATVLLPFTTDGAKIKAALATTPQVNYGTHVFDSLQQAMSLMATDHIKSGSIVLLSDGQDTGSTATLPDVTKQATAEGIRIFTVGLDSRTFHPTTLSSLAQGAGGQYTEATSSGQLAGIFDQLGAQLANQYVVSYQSLAVANTPVTVQVSVDHSPALPPFTYHSPSLKPLATNYNQTWLERWWSSPVSLIVIALLCAALVGYAVVKIVDPNRRAMRRRVTRFVTPEAIQTDDGPSTVTTIAETLYDRTEQTLAGRPRWERFKEEVEVAGVGVTASQLLVLSLAAGFGLAMIPVVVVGQPLLAILGLFGPVIAVMWINSRAEQSRAKFAEQLPINLEVLASALRAGHSLPGALKVVIEDAAEPSRSEFRRIVNDEQAGVPMEEAFERTVQRMQNTDLRQIAIVSRIQRESGGNTAEVLDRVTENIRARFELRRLVKTLTAQGRMSRWIVTALPLCLLLALGLINPHYLNPLFHTTVGLIFFIGASAMVVAGSLLIKKIVKIDL
jgi:tight adherence protein B